MEANPKIFKKSEIEDSVRCRGPEILGSLGEKIQYKGYWIVPVVKRLSEEGEERLKKVEGDEERLLFWGRALKIQYLVFYRDGLRFLFNRSTLEEVMEELKDG